MSTKQIFFNYFGLYSRHITHWTNCVIDRFVHFNSVYKSVEIQIHEHFLTFHPILDPTGAGLTIFS